MASPVEPVGVVPGTAITIYESDLPAPGIVLMTSFEIFPGTTLRKASDVKGEYHRNTIAKGDDKPLTGIVQGLGVTSRDRARILKEQADALIKANAPAQSRGGGGVFGWRIRALSAQNEIRLVGRDLGTQSKLTALWSRIAPGQKTWLEPLLPKGDPYRSTDGATYQAWIREDCIPWLIVEGSKMGLRFSAKKAQAAWRPAERLIATVASYVDDPSRFRCALMPVRERGVRLSSRTLGFKDVQAISADAGELYSAYVRALASEDDKRSVHEAYHRILLHRFLRRRTLVPKTRGDSVSSAAERRARLLQAHRIFVFNSAGCPVSLNKSALEANGIDLASIGDRDVTLIRPGLVNEWTQWLYRDVLEVPLSQCQVTGEISSLAMAGLLG